jgi:hypothetical protein
MKEIECQKYKRCFTCEKKHECNLEKYMRYKIRFYKNKMQKIRYGIDIKSIL